MINEALTGWLTKLNYLDLKEVNLAKFDFVRDPNCEMRDFFLGSLGTMIEGVSRPLGARSSNSISSRERRSIAG